MRKLFCMLLTAALMLSLNAWGDTTVTTSDNHVKKVKKIKKCFFPKSKKPAPKWLCGVHTDTAVGSAGKTEAGIAFMEQMAVADARVHLIRNLHKPVQQRTESGNNTSTTETSDEALLGTMLMESAYGPNGTLYVLIGIDDSSPQAH